ncbi:glycosyltransferase family 2 protein [Roseibium aggregatum]|uniref:N-glycosyltransferase n=1 Tax=Roseibium aggregatum TaxID=187304 RepID=A0A0M6Y254_9HYPH|nr:glycosyltransferase family 2 protein [Roseibium aggregatum]CTQ43768.1 N-glycosyltransferase [Roseibium aggregatum]
MLETLGKYAEADFESPHYFQLTPEVLLLVWDPAHQVNAAPRLVEQGGQSFGSIASVRLNRLDGRSRVVWAVSLKEKTRLSLKLSAGAVGSEATLSVDATKPGPAADAFAITNGLSQAACAVFVTTFLSAWSGMFRLGRSRSFVNFARELLRSVNDAPPVVDAVASIGSVRLLETLINSDSTDIKTAVVIGDTGVLRLDSGTCNTPYNGGKSRLFLGAVDMPQPPANGFLVLSGSWGLAIRKLAADNVKRTVGAWWATNARKLPEVRDYLVSDVGAKSDEARAAIRDLQVSDPLPARRHGSLSETGSFCAVETAVACEAGVLVGGWLRDPARVYQGLDILAGDAGPVALELHTFDGVLPETQGGYAIKRFVAFAPVGRALQHNLQPRFEVRLASGERELLVPPPQPGDIPDTRAKALSVVTPRHASDEVLATCLSNVLSDIQSRFRQSVGEPSEVLFGKPLADPTVSIVIPLYKVFEFIKVQLAAFSADSWLAENAEVIFVLDSPEQVTHVEDLLAGFHLLYGLPVRLVVMERNGGYALACNAGAEAARGRYLAMINSDVVPVEAGWLEQLCASLMMDEQVAAVGGKLLYADNAIQHAGLKFIQDDKGRWFNHHYYKGFPRQFPEASTSREVPGVTGACLVLSKADFETVGGFTTDFIVGDYEDSDLCLKLRKLNRKIYYLGDVELYHFERVSIRKNEDYTRGVASQYNRWLHQSRWQDDIVALMEAAERREKGLSA